MYPFALLLGLPFNEGWDVAQQMAKKIVTMSSLLWVRFLNK